MRHREQAALFVLLILLLKAALVPAQEPAAPPRIDNAGADTVFYCNDFVVVAPQISVDNVNIDESSEGIKISIANYKREEDTLIYQGAQFSAEWNEYYGYLALTGAGSAEEYEQAIRQVYYENQAEKPSLDTRSFSISLLDADYLPYTKHFYRYIKALDIKWTEARDSALNMNYYGLQGYLATITSATENNFIWSKIDGVGWIGASDHQQEGKWLWMDGPEAGTHFWQGTHNNGYAVNGSFTYWSENEPNNAHAETNNGEGEDYGHINQAPSKRDKSWNDLRNEGDGPNSQYYRPQGFVVEFGGLEGDPEVQLSATAYVKIGKIAFADKREYDICRGESVELNLEASEEYSYTWTPNENINSTSVSNPVVNPSENKTYRAVGKLDFCTDTADFKVNVNPIPQHIWESEYTICRGDSIELNPGDYQSYLWGNLDTAQIISVQNEGWYSVKLSNEFGCAKTDSTLVKWSARPELNYGDMETLVCGSKQQILELSFESNPASVYLSPMSAEAHVIDAATLSPTLSVNQFGNYQFQVEVTDEFSCNFLDTLDVEFHNQPTADFFIDTAKCKGYNLDINYTGTTVEPADFYWYSNDTVYVSGTDLDAVQVPLGYGIRDRSVGLRVNEQGCIAESSEEVFVTPKIDFWVEKNEEGCPPLEVEFRNTDIEEIESYSWDFGDGTSASVKTPEHTFENSGITDKSFNVSLTVVSTDGCENTGVLENAVTVHPIPTIGFDFNEMNCYTENGIVNYAGSASESDTFLWDLSGFHSDEIVRNPGVSPGPLEFLLDGRPTVEIGLQVISEFGCPTDSISKLYRRKPLFDVPSEPAKGCPPLELALELTSPDTIDDVNYTWNLGAGKTAAGKTVQSTYNSPDNIYDVDVIAESSISGCSDTLFLQNKVTVYPVPKASFDANPEVVLVSNPVVNFTNQSEGAVNFQWDFDDFSPVSEEENPVHSFVDMGLYNVSLSAFNEFGCIDTTSAQISVAFDKLFPPNAFSPNAAREEDREFRIYSEGVVDEGYQLLIFNRWGEVIFESNSQLIGWDGRMKNGNFAPAGVYSWVITYFDFLERKHNQQGTVTLLF